MTRLRLLLTTASVLLAMAAAATPAAELLILEKGSNTLAIVDPATLTVRARVATGPDPHEVIASSDGARAYISNYGGEGSALNFISVVDLTTYTPLTPIDLGALHSAHGLDFQGGKLYFTAETNKVIGRYDPIARKIDWVLGIGQDRTHMILVAKDLEHIYTANVSSGTISIVQTQMRGPGPPPRGAPPGGAAPPRPPVGSQPAPGFGPRKVWEVTNVASGRGSEGFDISPDGRQIWAANAQDGTITVIDVRRMTALQTFPVAVAGANRLKFTLDGRYALITGLGAFGPAQASGGNNLVVVDTQTHKLVKGLQLGGGSAGILMDPSGARAFVAVNQGGKVAIVDLHTLKVSGEIPANQPDGMAWAQDSAARPSRNR